MSQILELRPAPPPGASAMIHPTAIVEPGARIGAGAQIGPWCHVGPQVSIGAGARLVSHVVVDGHTTVGDDAVLYPFCTVGLAPQDLKYRGRADPVRGGSADPGPGALHDPSRDGDGNRADAGRGRLPADGGRPRRA